MNWPASIILQMGQALTITFAVTRDIHSTAIISNQQSAISMSSSKPLEVCFSICRPAFHRIPVAAYYLASSSSQKPNQGRRKSPIDIHIRTNARKKQRAKKQRIATWSSARSQSAGGPIDAAAAGLLSCPAPSPTRRSCEVDGADFESTKRRC